MRWRRPKFALFAVVFAAAALLGAPRVQAADPVDTDILLFWRENPLQQPTGNPHFFAAVKAHAGSTAPTGSVTIKFDDQPDVTLALKQVPQNDDLAISDCGSNSSRCAITDDKQFNLDVSPHFFHTAYGGATDAFNPSASDLGLATATLTASPEPSREGELVTYTFSMFISSATPSNRRPTEPVQFNDDDEHRSIQPVPLDSNLRATWSVGQRGGRWTTTAVYPGDDVYLAVQRQVGHNVTGAPTTVGNGPSATTTTRKVTPTTRRSLSGTTVPLTPISPTTTTTSFAEETTTSIFGAFPTTPGDQAAKKTSSNKKNDGPPLAVVATTLVALGVLGGIAAFRRYRRGGIDWF